MKTYLDFLLESKDKGIIVYHLSDELSHLKRCDFRLEYSKNENLFGHAIYFSTSSGIHSMFGKYMCKYLIYPDEPILNMNEKLSQKNAKKLIEEFNTMFKSDISFDILDRINCYGDLFEEMGGNYWEDNKYFKTFIQEHMGYNSFKYYQNSLTDFIHRKGDYGLTYGIYNPKNIKFVDGPL